MAYIDASTAKKHLNIEADFTEDDAYIAELCVVAEHAVEEHVNRKLSELVDASTGELPSPLTHAMLLMVDNLYNNRGIVSNGVQKLPRAYDYLIDLYRNYD